MNIPLGLADPFAFTFSTFTLEALSKGMAPMADLSISEDLIRFAMQACRLAAGFRSSHHMFLGFFALVLPAVDDFFTS